MRRQLLILSLALGAAACQGESSAAATSSNLRITVTNVGEGQRPPEGFEGIWIDIVPGVEYRSRMTSATGRENQSETWLNGYPFEAQDGWVVIGPVRYGPIAEGAHVEIRNDGVFADGAKLGDLPPRKPMPPDEG